VARFDPLPRSTPHGEYGTRTVVGVSGSAAGIAAVRTASFYGEPKSAGLLAAGGELRIGPGDGPLRRVSGCLADEPGCDVSCPPANGEVDDALLWVTGPGPPSSEPCASRGTTLSAYRLPFGEMVSTAPIPAGGPIRVAGRYLAYQRAERGRSAPRTFRFPIVVRDLTTGAELLRAPDDLVRAGSWSDFDVAADGTLVAVAKGPSDYRQRPIAWFSPRAPRAHPLAVRARYDSPIRIVGRKLVVERVTRPGAASALVLVGLRGHGRPLVRFGRGVARVGGVDYDGRRIAWAELACGRPAIRVARVSRLLNAPRRLRACRSTKR
jgi:hypothetical protein